MRRGSKTYQSRLAMLWVRGACGCNARLLAYAESQLHPRIATPCDRRNEMRQFAIVAVTAAVLCSPHPATAQGFQFGSERGSWDIQFDKRSFFPCYRLHSHFYRSHFHDDGYWPQKPRGDRGKFYSAQRSRDGGGYWLDQPGEDRRPRCIGLWESQR